MFNFSKSSENLANISHSIAYCVTDLINRVIFAGGLIIARLQVLLVFTKIKLQFISSKLVLAAAYCIFYLQVH